MRAWRWPALVLVPALVAAALVVTATDDGAGPAGLGLADLSLPTVGGEGSAGSTWYCAGGTATGAALGEGAGDDGDDGDGGDGEGPPPLVAEHVVTAANPTGEGVALRLTTYPSEGEPVVRTFDLAARSRFDVRLSDIAQAPYAAAVVEVDGGGVAVQHQVQGPGGRAVAPCASAPASSWYFPAGTTRAGARNVLALFNPFPSDAVVDITFDADDGSREPQAFQGLVVPAGRVLPVDVGAVVTLREELATAVAVRSGRIVVDQLVTAEEPGSSRPARAASGVPGTSLVLGAPLPSTSWLFPDGIGAAGYGESFALYNPGTEAAEVEVQVVLDDPDANGTAEPFRVTVGPRRHEVVDVLGDGRVPVGVAHATFVRSTNGVPVVAERSVVGSPDAVQPGVGLTMGAPLASSRWVAAVGSVAGASGAALIVANPSGTAEVSVRVAAVGGGRQEDVDEVAVEPGGRRIVALDGFAAGADGVPTALVVEADGPVVAEARFGFEQGDDLSYVVAAAGAGGLAPLG